MKKLLCRLVLILCVFALVLTCLTGCNDKMPEAPVQDVPEEPDTSWVDEISSKSKDPADIAIPGYSGGDSVTIGMNGEFGVPNPFYMSESADTTVADLLMVSLLETDRGGYVVQNGIQGETIHYNETEYTYDGIANVEVVDNQLVFTIDENVYFSDGVNLTADDVIFTMYVLADPAYDGNSTFASLPIAGINEYRGTMQQKWKVILSDLLSESTSKGYTEDDKEAFLSAFDEAGLVFTEEIVQGCVDHFGADYSEFVLDVSIDTLLENTGLQVAFSQYFWDYSTGYGEDGLWYNIDGNSYDLAETFPTIENYWQLIFEKHGYDISDNGINYEKIGDRDFENILISVISEKYPQLTVATADSGAADSISGIEKTGMYSFTITFTELAPDYLNDFCIYVAPLHYYGSREDYKYSENRFGFTKGDLSEIKSKSSVPLGAGAYTFASVEDDGDILLQRNPLYYKGCPNVTNLVITSSNEGVDLLYKEYAGEGAYTGNFKNAESNTYVTIGMNAVSVSVGGEALSEESVSLRNAFATVFKAYRETAVGQWEDQGIQSIQDETVWANDLEAVTRNARIEAISYLKAAGYTWDNELELFTAAPEGAYLSYEVKLYSHDAAYIVLNYAKELFADIGIMLNISVQSSRESLENLVNAGEAQIWVLQVDDFSTEDIYSMFHSQGTNNVFSASTEEMDKKIEWADSLFHKNVSYAVYMDIFEEVISLGVMVPIYKQIDSVVYSEDIVPESIASDMTAYWSWVREVHLLEAK